MNNFENRGTRELSQFDNLLEDAGVLDQFASLPNTPGVSSLLQRTDQLLAWLLPSPEAHRRRMAVFEFTRSVVRDCFGADARSVLIGSCALKTYLPDADIDMSVFVPKTCDGATDPVAALTAHICTVMQQQQAERVMAVNRASAESERSFQRRRQPKSHNRNHGPLQFHSVTCISADTCVIKCIVDNMSVDITFGQENAVASLELFERFDASYIGRNHMLKKSILLLKAWLLHDASRAAGDDRHTRSQSAANLASGGSNRGTPAPIYGAKDGGLCTYALNTMVTCLLNTHDVVHPLQAFILFFKVFADFDWDRYYVTLFGFVPLRSRDPMQFLGGSPNKASPGQSLKLGVQQIACFPERAIRSINIQDPLLASNNLGRSVSRASAKRFRIALTHGRHNLCVALSRSVNLADCPSMLQIFDSIFASCFSQFGRGDGWRPDMLDHPMQKWRNPPSRLAHPVTTDFDMTSMRLITSIRSDLRVFLDVKEVPTDHALRSGNKDVQTEHRQRGVNGADGLPSYASLPRSTGNASPRSGRDDSSPRSQSQSPLSSEESEDASIQKKHQNLKQKQKQRQRQRKKQGNGEHNASLPDGDESQSAAKIDGTNTTAEIEATERRPKAEPPDKQRQHPDKQQRQDSWSGDTVSGECSKKLGSPASSMWIMVGLALCSFILGCGAFAALLLLQDANARHLLHSFVRSGKYGSAALSLVGFGVDPTEMQQTNVEVAGRGHIEDPAHGHYADNDSSELKLSIISRVVDDTGPNHARSTLPLADAPPMSKPTASAEGHDDRERGTDPSTLRLHPEDLEPLPGAVRTAVAGTPGALNSDTNAGTVPDFALRHAPYYSYDFGGDPHTGAIPDTSNTLACQADTSIKKTSPFPGERAQEQQPRRKPRHVTSMVVVDPGATLTLSVASESRRVCPAGPERQILQSVLWYVGDALVQRSNRTFLTLRNVGAFRGQGAPIARVDNMDVFADVAQFSARGGEGIDAHSRLGALVSSYVTCVDRVDQAARTTYLGLRVRVKTSEDPILSNRVGRATGRVGQRLVLEGPLFQGSFDGPPNRLAEPYAMQWSRNGVDLDGETGERVVIDRFTPKHVGTYACMIETPNGKTRWGEWVVQQG